VAADPGVAGFWVARTFATTDLGGVQVPAAADTGGFAVACATVARLRSPSRPALAVVDGPLEGEEGGPAETAREAAARLGVAVPLAVWDGDGPRLTAEDHLDRLQVAVVAAAGAVVAWGGLAAV
jgi:hypothetical protein